MQHCYILEVSATFGHLSSLENMHLLLLPAQIVVFFVKPFQGVALCYPVIASADSHIQKWFPDLSSARALSGIR